MPKEAKDKPKEISKNAVVEAVPRLADPFADREARRAHHEARAQAFKALGDPIRLAICDYLAVSQAEQTAGQVCRAVTGDKKITAKVSHHLKELRRAGLIVMHKNGKNVLCKLNHDGISALSSYLAAWNEGHDSTNDINEIKGNQTNGDATISDNQIFHASPAVLVEA